MSAPWLTDQQQIAWRSYLRASRLLEVQLDQELRTLGLTLGEYELLSMLSEAPDTTMRMSAIADLVVQSRSRVSHAAARLEERGWVTRAACDDDKRGVFLTLTSSGMELLVKIAPDHAATVQRTFVQPLSDEQLDSLGASMANIGRAIASSE